MAEKVEQAIHQLEQAVALQGQELRRNSVTLARLVDLVSGNGDGRSLIIRIVTLEQTNEQQRQQIAELITRTTHMSRQQHAWRNQAIGISLTISILIATISLIATLLAITGAP